MKKFLLLSAIGMWLAASLSGCIEGDYISTNEPVVDPIEPIEFRISRPDWEVVLPPRGNENSIGSYFVYDFPLPEINGYTFDRGAIICYYRYVDAENFTVQTPLPYTYYMADEGTPRYQFELTYSFEISLDAKRILFKVFVSDFYTEESRQYLPSTSVFQLVMMY
jgi:hypothetical protein